MVLISCLWSTAVYEKSPSELPALVKQMGGAKDLTGGALGSAFRSATRRAWQGVGKASSASVGQASLNFISWWSLLMTQSWDMQLRQRSGRRLYRRKPNLIESRKPEIRSKLWSTKCKMVPLGTRLQNLLLQVETSSAEGNRWSLLGRWCTRQELEGKRAWTPVKGEQYSNSQGNY